MTRPNRATALLVLAAVVGFRSLALAQQEQPSMFVSLSFEGGCGDGLNTRTFLSNTHTSRDIMVTVRWRVANGVYKTDRFRSNAGTYQQIGCSSDASITAAAFLNNAENAAGFVTVRFGASCGDGQTSQVFLESSHSSRAIDATVRWRVANGQFTTVRYRAAPGTSKQIGCAADARVSAAAFAGGP